MKQPPCGTLWVLKAEGKRALHGFVPEIKCFSMEVTLTTYTHNSLAHMSHVLPPQSETQLEVPSYHFLRR